MLIGMMLNEFMCSLLLPLIIIGGYLAARQEEDEIEEKKKMRKDMELRYWEIDFSDKTKNKKRNKVDDDEFN